MRSVVLVGAIALATVTTGVALPSAAQASPVPAPTPTYTDLSTDQPAGTAFETIRYGKHRRQRMDVWWQPDGQRHPGVFVIHGGWWSGGDKRGISGIARSYAELGYTVFNVNYRLSDDAAWPAQRIDVLDAIATARRHAGRWSFNPNSYVLLGFSAGGHIATAVGTYKDGVPGLKGVVGISPVVSPLTAYADGADTLDPGKRRLRAAAIKLAGGCHPKGACAKIWASMEVPRHASRGDAPVLALHAQDEFVPPTHSELLKARLRQVGVGMSVRVFPGIDHSTALYRSFGVAESVQDWIVGKLG